MGTPETLAELRARGEVIWENRRYDATYVVDRGALGESLKTGIPVIHLGQREAVSAVWHAIPETAWIVVSLWCPRVVAETRIIARATGDLSARLAVWDSTEPLDNAHLSIDTSEISAGEAASAIRRQLATLQAR